MNTDQQNDEQKLKDQATALQAELDALTTDMKQTLPVTQSLAEKAEGELSAELVAFKKDVNHMDKELTEAEKDAQKHMNIVDEI
jgi:hypothetical protein